MLLARHRPPLGFLSHVLAKSLAQIVAADALKNDLKCSIYCHTKVSTDHDCGNLSALAERTQVGLLEDIPIDPELLDEVAGPIPPAPESVIGFCWFFFMSHV